MLKSKRSRRCSSHEGFSMALLLPGRVAFNQRVTPLPPRLQRTTLNPADQMKYWQSSPWGQCSLCLWNLGLHTPAAVLVPCSRASPESDGRGTALGDGGNRKRLTEMGIIFSLRWGTNTCFIHKLVRKITDLWGFAKSHSSYLLKMKALNSLFFTCTVPIGDGLYQGSNSYQMGAKCPLADCSRSCTEILS